MYPIFNTPESYESLNKEAKEILAQLLEKLRPRSTEKILPAQQSVFAENKDEEGTLFLVKEGIVSYSFNENILYFFDAGDLLGLEHLNNDELGLYQTDFAVVVDEYNIADVNNACSDLAFSTLWHSFLAKRLGLVNVLLSTCAKSKLETNPETLTLQPGEVIIEEGTVGSDVFTLVEGALSVHVNGVRVGEITADEIFGALAALTNTPRTATVKAEDFSIVLKLPKDRFMDLIHSRPLTVLKMIEDMSKTIVSLNDRVVRLSTKA